MLLEEISNLPTPDDNSEPFSQEFLLRDNEGATIPDGDDQAEEVLLELDDLDDDDKKREFIARTAEGASGDQLEEIFKAASKIARSYERKPQWSDRTTGREVSPADWIRMHYGTTLESGEWDPQGLKRADLKDIDFPLYQSFAKWIERHPEDAFDSPPSRKPRHKTKAEALDARRASEQKASKRYRQKLSSNI